MVIMIILNATQSSTSNSSAEQALDYPATVIIGVVLLASAIIGCSLVLLALGKDFFSGKNPPVVFVGALVWVDFTGAFSTSVIVFQGFVKGTEWMADSPQCSLQGFFTTAFGLSSGTIVTFMSLDRVASLKKPFLYKQHATPSLARAFCIFLTLFCLAMGALPFAGVGRYMFNKSSRSFCQFDWFPADLAGTVYNLAIGTCGALLILLMTFSNIAVFITVARIRRRMSAVLPSEMNARRRARRVAFRQEERMAKFVALVSIVFLVTWLPVTIRLFCNAFRAFPSNRLDSLSLRLVIANFILDPFTYVLFKGSFRRNLRRSISALTEFLGPRRGIKRQTTRIKDATELGITSGLGLGHFAEATMIEVDRPCIKNHATVPQAKTKSYKHFLRV